MGKKSAEEKARRDAVKRYLQQYHAAKREMGILEERRRTLSTELRGPSVSDPWRPAPAARHDPGHRAYDKRRNLAGFLAG